MNARNEAEQSLAKTAELLLWEVSGWRELAHGGYSDLTAIFRAINAAAQANDVELAARLARIGAGMSLEYDELVEQRIDDLKEMIGLLGGGETAEKEAQA